MLRFVIGAAVGLAISGYMIFTDLPIPPHVDAYARRRLVRSLSIRFACVMAVYTAFLILTVRAH